MPKYEFPKNFKWGSATSAHQIEGDNHNDWTEWEIRRAKDEAEKAKSMKWPEHILNNYPNPLQEENYISGKACDSYNRYEEDFDIAKSLNQNIHRFSIEWSRIEPEEGRFDEKEIQHYVNVVKALRDRGIEPMITLWHFTNPIWFAKKGGWLNPESPELFVRFINVVVLALKDQVGLWITFNEPINMYGVLAYLKGYWPPQHRSIFEWRKVNKNIVRAHIESYKEIKKIYNQSPVSFNKEIRPRDLNEIKLQGSSSTSHNVEPLVGVAETTTYIISGPVFRILGNLFDKFRNFSFWNRILPYQDFIGLNYYTSRRLPGSFTEASKGDSQELMGWEIYPRGIYNILLKAKKLKKPIFITENGIADSTDQKRTKFIKGHLYWIHKAIQDGVDVRGYFYWSLLDNFEWAHGYSPRFGLVEIDYKTFERHIRPSALEYAKICITNQLEIDS